MIISNKYEVPDTCPKNCIFKDDLWICIRCPIFNCSKVKNPDFGSMIPPEKYRADWAEKWNKFFKDGTFPELQLYHKKEK